MPDPQVIDWPQITVGGRSYMLRLSYAASYQLTSWGVTVNTANMIQLAAAMAGNFDKDGKWHSAGFKNPLDLADAMERTDEAPLIAAVEDAIKKAFPDAKVEVVRNGGEVVTMPPSPTTETNTSGS